MILNLICFIFMISEVTTLKSEFPGRKTWWAKEINPDLYVSGRLDERQVRTRSRRLGINIHICSVKTYKLYNTLKDNNITH